MVTGITSSLSCTIDPWVVKRCDPIPDRVEDGFLANDVDHAGAPLDLKRRRMDAGENKRRYPASRALARPG